MMTFLFTDIEEDWPEIGSLVVRIALHSGKAERREECGFG